jgi:hypothetical protein
MIKFITILVCFFVCFSFSLFLSHYLNGISGRVVFCSVSGDSKICDTGLEFCMNINILKILSVLNVFFTNCV